MDDGDREQRYVAVAPNGQMLLQMKGISGTIIGYLHRHTGEFVTPQTLARMQHAPNEVPLRRSSTGRSDLVTNIAGTGSRPVSTRPPAGTSGAH